MPESANKAVFLSYASQDAEAARRICEALRNGGVEVWFDLNELRGGDAWDQKIRRQIKECALFVPLISANTNARLEGYYRLEWKLAIDRSHLMAEEKAFLLPVVIDETSEATAKVPDRFRDFQWTRLRLDETLVQFSARVATLLFDEGAPVEPALSGSRRDQRSEASKTTHAGQRPALPRSRRVPLAAWIIVGLIVAAAGAFLALRPRRSPEEVARLIASAQSLAANATASAQKSAAPPTPALSESRQLLAKAKALFEPWDGATHEDFALAEELLKRAVSLDPTDGEVWAGYALLGCGQLVLAHDTSPARFEIARTAAERAIKLAPDSLQARFAHAFTLRFQDSTQDEAERLLRELAGQAPDDRLILRVYGSVLRIRGKFDESLAVFDRAIALPGGDPVAEYNKFLTLSAALRFTEAEAVLDRGLAHGPKPYFYRAKARCLMLYHGDLDGAAAMLTKVPGAYLLEDSGAFWASEIWLWRREPDKSLAVWRSITREQVECAEFHGPVSFITGKAHFLAGRTAAAQAEWTAALRMVERQLAASPSAVHWVYWKARLLAALERRAEAEEALKTFEQLVGAKGLVNDSIPVYLLLGRHAEVLDALEKGRASLVTRGNPGLLAQFETNLRFNPEWDLLRDEPRFAALLKKSEPAK